MTPVYWLSLHEGIDARGPFDTGILEALFSGDSWPMHRGFRHERLTADGWLPTIEGNGVIVLPARHHAQDVADINTIMSTMSGVVLMLIGDEDSVFPWAELHHPNMRLWVMIPDRHKHAGCDAFFLGDGFPPGTREQLSAGPLASHAPAKPLPWAFSGQATHERRKQAASAMWRMRDGKHGEMLRTEGFTQGLPRHEYIAQLARTRVAPCPSGPVTADTFRFYEALEAGCMPLPDAGYDPGYWRFVYGNEFPFPQIHNWEGIESVMSAELDDWPVNANIGSAWWVQRKREMAERLDADLATIGDPCERPRELDVVIPTSPIPSHPSTAMLEDTMGSVAQQLGIHQIQPTFIIACDGVREQQAHMAEAYNEYVRQVCWLAMHGSYAGVVPVVSGDHLHQAGTVKLAMKQVRTAQVLFVEHDTPFTTDYIDWGAAQEFIADDGADVLRFHHEHAIHPEHEYLMIDHETQVKHGLPFRRTTQFSARPHLADTQWYRDTLRRQFRPGSNGFIEDRLHSVCQVDPENHRLAIYHPKDSIMRTLHSDGRAGGPKFEEAQRFS